MDFLWSINVGLEIKNINGTIINEAIAPISKTETNAFRVDC